MTLITSHPLPKFTEKLPVGLQITSWKMSGDELNLPIPASGDSGLLLTFINYKGDLHIASGDGKDGLFQASPGLGLLSLATQPLLLRSITPIQFAAVTLFISADWIAVFLKNNPNFQKIEQAMEEESSIVTCRLGRRQLTLLSAIAGHSSRPDKETSGVLEIQNHALCLLEHFFCSRHRNLAGVNASTGIDNEDDLSLIREVESYISEYYCSDTFTVDSILKKTYTSYHKLNFLFKSIHGMTISEYIRNKRIEKSREMIADNVKSISQIAYEIGYSSISNYILAFKKIYRITPGKYKKQMDNIA
jgi:AraC-like DNA-binding protein